MLPVVAILVPLVVIVRSLGLINTLTALVFTHLALGLPVAVWMLKGYVDAIPRELEEAAMIDGCGRFGALRYVLFPLLRPARGRRRHLRLRALLGRVPAGAGADLQDRGQDPAAGAAGGVRPLLVQLGRGDGRRRGDRRSRRSSSSSCSAGNWSAASPPAASRGRPWQAAHARSISPGPAPSASRRSRCATPGRARSRSRRWSPGISAGTELNVYRGLAPQWRKHMDPKTRLFLDGGADWTWPARYGYASVGRITAAGPGRRGPPAGRSRLRLRAARHRQRRAGPAPWSPLGDICRPDARRLLRQPQHRLQRRARRPPGARLRRRRLRASA